MLQVLLVRSPRKKIRGGEKIFPRGRGLNPFWRARHPAHAGGLFSCPVFPDD
jgi:hypothetical protein